jgi:hypothetical protein
LITDIEGSVSMRELLPHFNAVGIMFSLTPASVSLPFSASGLSSLVVPQLRERLAHAFPLAHIPSTAYFLTTGTLADLARQLTLPPTAAAARQEPLQAGLSADIWTEALFASAEEATAYLTNELGLPLSLIQQRWGEPATRLQFLQELCAQFWARVPFQSFTLVAAAPTTLPSLAEIKRLVLSRTGGLCVVLNIFMGKLLAALGYATFFTLTTIHGVLDCHITVIVTGLLEPADLWNIDVGTGYLLPQPVCLSFTGPESPIYAHGSLQVKFVHHGSTLWRLHGRASLPGLPELGAATADDPDFPHKFWALPWPPPPLTAATPASFATYLAYQKIRATSPAPNGLMRSFKIDPSGGGGPTVSCRMIEDTGSQFIETTLSWAEMARCLSAAFPTVPSSDITRALARLAPGAAATEPGVTPQ